MSGSITASSGLGNMAQAMDKQMFGAEVVSKTLDYMNQNQNGYSFGGADYDFQKSVLGPAYSGTGAIMNIMG